MIGLLTADDGEPLAVKVFKGNTADPVTVADQLEILTHRLKIDEVVFVGDRGMVKSKTKAALTDKQLRYITALTDPQVRKLLKKEHSTQTRQIVDRQIPRSNTTVFK